MRPWLLIRWHQHVWGYTSTFHIATVKYCHQYFVISCKHVYSKSMRLAFRISVVASLAFLVLLLFLPNFRTTWNPNQPKPLYNKQQIPALGPPSNAHQDNSVPPDVWETKTIGREAIAHLTYLIGFYGKYPETIAFIHPHWDGWPGTWHTNAANSDNVSSLNQLRTNFV